jgi:hypothetical protein
VKRRGGYYRRERDTEWLDEHPSPRQNNNNTKRNGGNPRFDRSLEMDAHIYEHPKWSPPVLSIDPLPVPNCSCCGKPVRDIATAVDDKIVGAPAHFDCIISRLAETEHIEKGDSIAYIGGGRFGVVRFGGSRDKPAFKILKIFEWENKDNRSEWRESVRDHYSLT